MTDSLLVLLGRVDYPVRQFSGTKSVVFSTVSWMGGKNPFLGWAYVATAILFVVLAVAGTAKHLLQPRRMGDMSSESPKCLRGGSLDRLTETDLVNIALPIVLSWNQNK
jgi:hypothetical protein